MSAHLTSEFQYVLTFFLWMLQRYCACHEKAKPRHTNSGNCPAKWSAESSTSRAANLQPFQKLSLSLKHQPAKSLLLPLEKHPCGPSNPASCQCLCDPNSCAEITARPRDARTSKNAPSTSSKSRRNRPVFNHFDFGTTFSLQRGASWAAVPPQLPFLGVDFLSLRNHTTVKKHGKHSVSCNFYLPNLRPISVTSLCFTSARQKSGGNSQYSWKLDSQTSFDNPFSSIFPTNMAPVTTSLDRCFF